MTWTGWATVEDVSDGPAPIDVLLTANADDTHQPWEGNDTTVPCLSSNTEGKLRSVEIKMVFDEDDPPLAIGDVVNIQGHFTRRTPTADA